MTTCLQRPMAGMADPESALVRLSAVRLALVVAVLVACAVAIAAFAGILPLPGFSKAHRSPPLLPVTANAPASPASRCSECGVVLMIRTFELRADALDAPIPISNGPSLLVRTGKPMAATVYRVTVRMDDGSYRTLSQSVTPAWKPGDAVRLAEGSWVAR
jgi:hypothetical protein